MIEVMIERWTDALGATEHIWSLWRDGRRLQMGNKHDTADAAEIEARAFCLETLGVEPERTIRL